MQDISESTHMIMLFDCCRGKKATTQAVAQAPRFQLSVGPSALSHLKNSDLKNSYIFHATLPHQVVKTWHLLLYPVSSGCLVWRGHDKVLQVPRWSTESGSASLPWTAGRVHQHETGGGGRQGHSRLQADGPIRQKGPHSLHLVKRIKKHYKYHFLRSPLKTVALTARPFVQLMHTVFPSLARPCTQCSLVLAVEPDIPEKDFSNLASSNTAILRDWHSLSFQRGRSGSSTLLSPSAALLRSYHSLKPRQRSAFPIPPAQSRRIHTSPSRLQS